MECSSLEVGTPIFGFDFNALGLLSRWDQSRCVANLAPGSSTALPWGKDRLGRLGQSAEGTPPDSAPFFRPRDWERSGVDKGTAGGERRRNRLTRAVRSPGPGAAYKIQNAVSLSSM